MKEMGRGEWVGKRPTLAKDGSGKWLGEVCTVWRAGKEGAAKGNGESYTEETARAKDLRQERRSAGGGRVARSQVGRGGERGGGDVGGVGRGQIWSLVRRPLPKDRYMPLHQLPPHEVMRTSPFG